MIDFQNKNVFKLTAASNDAYAKALAPMLCEGERIELTFKSMRDGIVFTSRRIIAINMQGITGKKTDFTSLPYSKIQAYSVETAGVLDFDSEIELWFSGLGRVKIELVSSTNVAALCRLISEKVL